MKKFTVGVVTLLVTLLLCLTMSGCSSSVSGKTYEFDDIEVQYSGDVSEEAKETFEKGIDALKATYKLTYKFEDDGNYKLGGVTAGTYEQDGSTVTLKAPIVGTKVAEFTVSGSKLKQKVVSSDDISFTVIYKQV